MGDNQENLPYSSEHELQVQNKQGHNDYPPVADSDDEPAKADLPNSNARKRPILFAVVGFVLLLGVIAAAAYFMVLKKSPDPAMPAGNTQSIAPKPDTTGQINSSTKNYASPNFYLSFDYPKDWSLRDDGGGIMTVTSPVIPLKSARGDTVSGQIVVSFKSKDQKLAELDAGDSVASMESVKLNYVKPTPNQRAATYESFLRYSASTNKDALDAVYITGDNGYKLDQNIPKSDIQKVDPIISITFLKCSDKNCSAKSTALGISKSSWANENFSGPLEKILKSITIN